MAKAKKLPSGSWRVQVYSHTEPVTDKKGKPVINPKTGKQKEKRIYESFTSDDPSPAGRREAELAAAEFASNKNRRTKSNLTFGEALDKYIEQRSSILSPRTITSYKRIREAQIQDIMNVKLRDINQEIVQKVVNNDSLNHSPKTVRNNHGLIAAVLGQFMPALHLKTDLPKKVRAAIYVPSDDEIQRLIKYVSGTEMELPILLSAFGPMRRGEICALDADHIEGNIVHVELNMVLDVDRSWTVKSPKSYAGNRYIEYPDFIAEMWKDKKGRITNLNPDEITKRFARILKKSGLPHFRFHDLRHYSASVQHALGIPDSYIMARGGWGNDGTLKTVYRHTMESKEKEMNQIANRHFEKLCNTKSNMK